MKPAVLLASAAMLIALVGCTPTGGGTSDSPSASAPSATPSSTPTEATGGGDAATACTRDNLEITYAEADASAGHRHAVLTFANSGSTPCGLDGYPVVYMGSSEVAAPVGLQATEDAVVAPTAFTLQPGQAATAALTITQAGIVEGCTVASSTHLIVAPPLDHAFVWEDDGRNVPTPAIDSCFEQSIGLLSVGALQPV